MNQKKKKLSPKLAEGKKLINIRAKINKIENRKIKFFEKINIIYKPLARISSGKEDPNQQNYK